MYASCCGCEISAWGATSGDGDAAKSRGAGDEFLAELLVRRGWSSGEVYDALGDWWSRTAGMEVPRRLGTAENARDAFLYLLAFSTLATWATALGSLGFSLIEYLLPDQVTSPYGSYHLRATVTWQMAAILVALPIYLFVMRLILRETGSHPERMESGVRKWLTYLALFLTAMAVVSDLVCFADYLLKGEITLRFVLKCVTVLAIAGSIFWYYLGFLRGRTSNGWFAALAVAGAAASFAGGLAAAGTPAAQRHLEADNRRVQDLQMIAAVVAGMRPAPHSLADIGAARPGVRLTDPETGRFYEFAVRSGKEYELCATFAAAENSGFWSHRSGRTCFPQRFP